MSGSALKPAAELARANAVRFPNESAEYRRARAQLLAEEIELRRHIERVAEQRRALPPGGEVTKDYAFEGEGGKATLPELFGDKQTLVIYSYMFGPQRERPCPMCTSFMSAWDGEAARHRAAYRVGVRGALADRAADRGEEGARLDAAPDLFGPSGRLTPATMSARPMPKCPATTCSRAATAASAISGPAKWGHRPPTPARIRAARRISIRCGPFWTPRPRAAARTGIRACATEMWRRLWRNTRLGEGEKISAIVPCTLRTASHA